MVQTYSLETAALENWASLSSQQYVSWKQKTVQHGIQKEIQDLNVCFWNGCSWNRRATLLFICENNRVRLNPKISTLITQSSGKPITPRTRVCQILSKVSNIKNCHEWYCWNVETKWCWISVMLDGIYERRAISESDDGSNLQTSLWSVWEAGKVGTAVWDTKCHSLIGFLSLGEYSKWKQGQESFL